MPCPKKKLTRSRRGNRRAHSALSQEAITRCPNCSALARPHRVCPSCGYYKGKEVIAAETPPPTPS